MASTRDRIRNRLLDLLSEDEPASTPQKNDKSKADPIKAAMRRFISNVERALGGDADAVPVGALHVVGFTKLRERLGDKWAPLQEHLQDLAAHLIQDHLPEGSTYVPYGDSFLLVLPDIPEDEARMMCAWFAAELERQILGEENTGDIEVRSVVRLVDRQDVAQDDLADRVLDGIIEGSDEEPPLPEQPIRLAYQPMLDVRKEAVSAYQCLPSRISRYGRLMLGDEALVSRSGQPDFTKLDRHAVNKAVKDLFRMHDEGKKFFLIIPVHFETLAGQVTRTAYYDLCKTLPSNLRQFALYELIGLPEGIPAGRVREVASLLKHYGRAVFARVPVETANLSAVKDGGCIGAGFDASEVPLGLPGAMRKFTAATAAAGLRSFVYNVRDAKSLVTATGAGFAFVGGDAVGRVIDHPKDVYKLRIKPLDEEG
ncbi:MAG: hypothetical protein CMM50_09195 [Rhodospirillaceae bacterium]|nr:hypothetical protein [Rhodospirillaceae bacterium]